MVEAGTRDPLESALLDSRYLVQAKIASGGTSTVYRGLDVRLDRPVALKVMDSRYAGDEQFLTRFRLEARAVARLNNRALVAVYDQGKDGRHPFLVMELIEGGTLRELLIERGPMPPHAVVAVLRPVLGGLAAAHRAGLVHRDVKPENILISDDGDVKLADFGLVRAVAAASITSTGVILGTAAYLSPEQVRDGNADPRSDVYSVGVLVYELLTGHTPFTGDSALSIAYQRLDADVPRASAVIDTVYRHNSMSWWHVQLPATLPTDTPMRSRWAPIWRRSPRSWPCLNSGYRRRATPLNTGRPRCTAAGLPSKGSWVPNRFTTLLAS